MRAQLMTRAAISVLLAAAALTLPSGHATVAAGTGGGEDGPVWTEGGDVLGQLRSQIGTLEAGSADQGGSPPPPCEWYDSEGELREDGTPRWRAPSYGSDHWLESQSVNPDGSDGTVWRYECWHDEMEEDCRTPQTGEGPCLGRELFDTWCDDFLCVFDAVTPGNLALLVAEDQFLEQLNTPQPRFSPPNEETLVNFATWLWVDNIPETGEDGPWSMSIMDGAMSVEARATMGGVRWDMGDANDPDSEFDCPLTTTEADAKDNCTYEYKRSSAGQPDNEFQGSVSVVWEVNWVANVFGVELTNAEPIEATLDNEFSLAVAESQAIVTED